MMGHASGDRQPNRLGQETSPYLQQHAYNPVDWYPWGEEAFEKAKQEDKPIFLSVGYSACHWCHVMERESFENEQIAKLLNDGYISIKVDREERPDVDQIYMSAVQLITKRGGWPMSVFMTPDGKPFYGGTYWPPTARMGMPGFGDLVVKLHDYWVNKRDEVERSAEQLVEAIQQMAAPVFERAPLNEQVLRKGMDDLVRSLDRRHGGFGGAPKFPHAMDLRVLLRCWKRFQHQPALDAVNLTLTKMAYGGIYDQLGGGFHRYSTDAYWLVPHFEKMLYDNALLVPAYLEAYQATGENEYATTVRETLDYVLREMTAPEGGFYATQDADSEGVEGKFFVWSAEEITDILGADVAQIFSQCYDVTPAGNWEGHSILNRPHSIGAIAAELGQTREQLQSVLDDAREKLFAVRSQRIAPGRDDKIIVAWNGMMIAAMAQAGRILNESKYTQAAARAARFIVSQVRSEDGQLRHSYKDGRAQFTAYLDDYACLIDGLVELFQSQAEEAASLLDVAVELADELLQRFADEEEGGFFYTAADHEELIARTKDSQDNATPSGNGMAATALLKLGRLTGRRDVEQAAIRTLESLSGLLIEHPRAAGQSLLALDFALGPTPEIVVIDKADGQAESLWQEVWKTFTPNKLAFQWPGSAPIPVTLNDLLIGKSDVAESSAFVCDRGACQQPSTTAEDLRAQLEGSAMPPSS